MPRHAGLDGHFGGFAITNFADHDHIGILPQDGPQAAREAHLGARVDLGLGDALQLIFDRVFDRHDVALVIVQRAERGVERGRLARSGWATDQNHPVGPSKQAFEQSCIARIHA